ncbi:MAG: WhiB family transcriptional regulator [Mycobacteriaceae bacterium]|nr:WhiB family transcriptional regulator [Mycobacteriaceae bacterium]
MADPSRLERLNREALTSTTDAWRRAAICAQTDPEIFFPELGGSVREAKRLCARCPVRRDCLAHALQNREHHGVWGGLSDNERRQLVHR